MVSKIDWTSTTADYQVFPPAPTGKTFGELGWFHNGTLSLLIMEKGCTNSVSTDLPGEDSIVSFVTTKDYPLTSIYRSWMEYFSASLEKLTLTEMTLPGSHDSGTYSPVFKLGTPWIRTQKLTLAQQLAYGIRVLDLRIGQNSPGEYIICHGRWRTRYHLAAVLNEVKDFIDSTNKEVVILDFHSFHNLGRGSYDYTQLKQQIASSLSGYCVPSTHSADTLETIWSSGSPKERVVVAWKTNSDDTSDPDPYMWPGVNQRWYGQANSLSKVRQCIQDDMQNPLSGMWSTCAFRNVGVVNSPSRNARIAAPTMKNWFFGGSMFCEKANIISADFFNQRSNIVQASIIGSLLKAGKK